jgi:hypothetical protein
VPKLREERVLALNFDHRPIENNTATKNLPKVRIESALSVSTVSSKGLTLRLIPKLPLLFTPAVRLLSLL